MVITPIIPDDFRSAWAYYSVLTESEQKRKELMTLLKKQEIPTAVYYPKPLHLQQVSTHLGYDKGDFPVAEDVCCRIFSLPMHAYLEDEDLAKIANVFQGV